MCDKCFEAVERIEKMIGDQSGDLTGVALDAWVQLGDARRAHEPTD